MKTLKEILSKSFDKILPRLEKFYPDSPKVIAFTKRFFQTLGNAPVVIFAYYIPTGDDYSDVQSVSAAIQNLLLAAHALGLGTCWMTGPIHVEREINEALGIKDKKLVAVITVGYPAKKPPTPPRNFEGKVVWML